MKSSSGSLPYRVRRSKIHGTGVFATRRIPKGERVVEYLGERVSHAEADRRYADKADDDNHTFLFTVDARVVIDAGVGGNAARWINHSCDPNCETVVEDRRIFIEAIRDIEAGDELVYDYMIERDASDPPNIDLVFSCRCGAAACRGTMLLPPKRPKRPAARRPVRVRQRPATRQRA
jgi:SET domain-containing protein